MFNKCLHKNFSLFRKGNLTKKALKTQIFKFIMMAHISKIYKIKNLKIIYTNILYIF